MRLVSTKLVKENEILAQPIYNEQGTILLQKDIHLTSKMINRLLKRGITYVYIKDDITEDVVIESILPDELRRDALHSIQGCFVNMHQQRLMNDTFILDDDRNRLGEIVQRITSEIQEQEQPISLLSDIFLTDDYLFRHSLNVAIYSLAIGVELQLSVKELSLLGTGAILHDIGKIFIEPKILQKPSRLTNEEYKTMQSHTTLGFNLLRKQSNVSSVVAHCAYQHHERLDGSGYPRGLKKHEIHPLAKIIAIADVFDAVTSNRVYRDAMLPHEGLEVLYAGAVDLFDIDLVNAFKKGIMVYPNGLSVELSDGRIGVIVNQNKYVCDRPIVRVVQDKLERKINAYDINLATETNVTIVKCNVS